MCIRDSYDAIYLEKPTHLLNYFQEGKSIGANQLLEYLFEVEYLTEGGAINLKEKRERIRYAFRRVYDSWEKSPSNQHLYQRRAVALHYSRVLIQAVGRLSRTRLKSPITHILYDSAISDYMQYFPKANFLLVKEFETLYDHCVSSSAITLQDEFEIDNLNVHNSLSFAALLQKLVGQIPNWNKETIRFWTKLRHFVLQNPTISKADLEKSGMQKLYLTVPGGRAVQQYSFQSLDDFNHNLTIDFDKQIGREVSADNAFLSQLLQIDLIRELFEKPERRYATEFKPNRYILNPVSYTHLTLPTILLV